MRLKAKERIMKEKEAESDLKEKTKKKKYLQTLQKEGIVRQKVSRVHRHEEQCPLQECIKGCF